MSRNSSSRRPSVNKAMWPGKEAVNEASASESGRRSKGRPSNVEGHSGSPELTDAWVGVDSSLENEAVAARTIVSQSPTAREAGSLDGGDASREASGAIREGGCPPQQ